VFFDDEYLYIAARCLDSQPDRITANDLRRDGSGIVARSNGGGGQGRRDRRSLWCGAFMDMVLKRTGHRGGGNLARGYASYGTRVSGPQIGALAVMSRGRGGGHVGVVSGIDANGNVIVVSGNHNNTVAESVYPRGRIFAYVMPGA